MILPDISVWIEFLRQRQPLAAEFERLLSEHRLVAASPVFGEQLQGARDDTERNLILGYWKALPHLPEADLLVKAGHHSGEHRLLQKGVGLIDASLLVLARTHQIPLWTLDRKLDALLFPAERHAFP